MVIGFMGNFINNKFCDGIGRKILKNGELFVGEWKKGYLIMVKYLGKMVIGLMVTIKNNKTI